MDSWALQALVFVTQFLHASCGCFYNCSVGVLLIRALLHRIYIRAPGFGKLPCIDDTQDDPGYFSGDLLDSPTFDRFSDAGISAVIGETDYASTGFVNNSFIASQSSGDPLYCAGCISTIAGKLCFCYDVVSEVDILSS